METMVAVAVNSSGHWRHSTPHSLGKLIEWKPVGIELFDGRIAAPHSLGKLIEWKLCFNSILN